MSKEITIKFKNGYTVVVDNAENKKRSEVIKAARSAVEATIDYKSKLNNNQKTEDK